MITVGPGYGNTWDIIFESVAEADKVRTWIMNK
jgi:hypothetical protein